MSVDQVFDKLRLELENTRIVVAELESRIAATEEINLTIIQELRHLVQENDIENRTLVDVDRVSDDGVFSLSFPSSPTLDETYKQIEMASRSPSSPNGTLIMQEPPGTTTKLSISHEEEENISFNRICDALQNLIKDAQLALLKAPSNNQFLDPTLGYRSRSTSFSSSVENWVLDQSMSSQSGCGCETCWTCLGESQSGKQVSQFSGGATVSDQKEGLDDKATIHKTRPQLTSEYRKSCENLENEFQKFISAAFSLDPKDQNASDNQNFETDHGEVRRVYSDENDIQCNVLDRFDEIEHDGLITTINFPGNAESLENEDDHRVFYADKFSIYSSLRQKWVNIFWMIGLIVGTAKMMMVSGIRRKVYIRNMLTRPSTAKRPSKKGENSKIIISVIKYISVLVVGWSFGRVSKGGNHQGKNNSTRAARPIAYTNIRI